LNERRIREGLLSLVRGGKGSISSPAPRIYQQDLPEAPANAPGVGGNHRSAEKT